MLEFLVEQAYCKQASINNCMNTMKIGLFNGSKFQCMVQTCIFCFFCCFLTVDVNLNVC